MTEVRLTAKVGQKSSTYNGVTVYEKQIQELVGMDTYASLYFLFPDLYYTINHPMKHTNNTIQIIQSVMINSNYLPYQVKQALVQAIVTKEPDKNILPLIGSSKPTKEWNSEFFSSAWFILLLSLFIVLSAWLLYIYIFIPLYEDYR
jgi:hypothetical protein